MRRGQPQWIGEVRKAMARQGSSYLALLGLLSFSWTVKLLIIMLRRGVSVAMSHMDQKPQVYVHWIYQSGVTAGT
jgi:hypothetical protein